VIGRLQESRSNRLFEPTFAWIQAGTLPFTFPLGFESFAFFSIFAAFLWISELYDGRHPTGNGEFGKDREAAQVS
jgi:hypothetical protein